MGVVSRWRLREGRREGQREGAGTPLREGGGSSSRAGREEPRAPGEPGGSGPAAAPDELLVLLGWGERAAGKPRTAVYWYYGSTAATELVLSKSEHPARPEAPGRSACRVMRDA